MTEKEMLQRVLQDMMVLKKIILDHINGSKAPEADKEIMSLEECAEYTGLKKSTLYQLTSQKKIPHFVYVRMKNLHKLSLLVWGNCTLISSLIA